MPSRRHLPALAVPALWSLLALTGCINDVDDGADFFEPEDTRDNEELQGLYDCTERGDTGYRQGNSFSIDVVTVDGKPVETATANAYIAMQNAAAQAGVALRVVSGFRTMSEQQHLYGCYTSCTCNSCNLAARPGYSNHQSGHALDLNARDPGVQRWLDAHADEFGFARTVSSEPWHWEWWGDATDYSGPCGEVVPPPPPASCDALSADGGIVDDGTGCFTAGGPAEYLRSVDGGYGGHQLWTGTTTRATAANFAEWALTIPDGSYDVSVYVDGAVATSRQAKYKLTHAGRVDAVVVNQAVTSAGWVSLGTFPFAGAGQRLRLDDNTGESGKHLVLDAVRLTPAGSAPAQCPRVVVDTDGSSLNLRPSASTSGTPLDTLDDGAALVRIETVNGQAVSGDRTWHRVRTADALEGYVAGAFVRCE